MDAAGRLLLDILKQGLKGEQYTPGEELNEQQWQSVLKLAWEHHLTPLVFEAVHNAPGLQDTALAASTRRQVRQSVAAQARKTAEFLELNDRFLRAGVTPLVVKGLVCRELYRMPDHRISGDEDILIPPEQYPLARRILEEYGMTTPQQEVDPERIQEVPWRKMNSPLFIELHLNLFPPDSSAYGELNRYFRDVFCRAEEMECQGKRILTMNPGDHLFYLICHAFKHFLHSGFGIRQVCDIVMFGRHYEDRIDWVRLCQNCRDIRAERFVAALFEIGRNHLGLTPPEGYRNAWRDMKVDELPLLEDLLESGVYGGADMERRHSSNITLSAAADRNRGRKQRNGVMQSLFPPASSLRNRYPYLKKAPVLLPVAWISRIVTYGKQHGGKTAASGAQSIRIGNSRLELMRWYGILDEP